MSAGILEFGNTAAQPTGLTTVGTGGTLALAVGGPGQFTAANVNQYYANTLPRVNTVSRSLGIDTTAGDASLGGFNVPAATSVSLNKLGTNALNLGAITRAAGGTANFTVTNGTLTTTTQNTGGSILGGYATFGGNTWAVSAGDGTNPGAITGLAAGSYTPSVAATTAPGSTADVDFQASNTTAYTGQTINSLRFNTAAALTLTLSGTNIITTGGILNTSTVGANNSTITGGTLEGSAAGELIVTNTDASNSIQIASIIANNGTATGLTKSGVGQLGLNSANTYTGPTVINAGILQLQNSFGGKILNTSGVVTAAGASLSFSGGNIGGSESGLVGGVISGAGGVIDNQGNPNTSFTLDKANTYTGPTIMNNRGVLVSSAAAVYDGSGNMISSGVGVNSALTITNFAGDTFLLNSNTQFGSLSTGATAASGATADGIELNGFNLITGGDNTSATFNSPISGGAFPGGGAGAARNIGGNLTKIGAGTQTLGGNNLYTGSTTITGGTLSIATIANGGFATTGTGTGTTANPSNQLTLANATGAVPGQVIEAAILGSGAEVISSVSGNVVTLNGTTTAAATNTPVAFGTANGLGISTNAASNLVLNGGTLQYTGAAASTDRLFTVGATTAGATGTLDASGTGALNFTNTGAIAYGTTNQTRTLGLTGTSTAANTLAPSIADNGAGAVSLNKTGVGSWTLTGNNTYTGTTTVSGGILNATGTGPNKALGGTTGIAINNGGTLLLGAANQASTAAAITVGTTAAQTPASTTGILSVAAGANQGVAATSTGGTVNGSVTTGGTPDGTTTTAGLGALTLSNTATLAFGGANTTLVFGTFTPNGNVLTITGYTNAGAQTAGNSGMANDDRLVFSGDQTSNLADFNFGPGAGVGVGEVALDNNFYEITVSQVPEPSTYVGCLLLLGGAGWSYRRRRSRQVVG